MSGANKVLIIEDDSTIRTILTHVLSEQGYEIVACVLLREAKGLLESDEFDLIISDIGLPDGNGLDFCGQYALPYISMSATEGIAPLAIASGAKAFIEKPFAVEEMLSAIKRVI